MAVANLIDALQLLKVIAVEVGTPIERIGRNIYTLGALGNRIQRQPGRKIEWLLMR